MALRAGLLRTEKDSENFFQKAGIPEDTSKTYAKSFKNNRVNELLLTELTKGHLKGLEVTQRNLHQRTRLKQQSNLQHPP